MRIDHQDEAVPFGASRGIFLARFGERAGAKIISAAV
jgi:hypothetical protein